MEKKSSEKTLKVIQTIAKIAKVLSTIFFVIGIVGFCLCVVGIIFLAVGFDSVQIGSVTVRSIIAKNAEMSNTELYMVMVSGLIECAVMAVLCKFTEIYCKHELSDGTPFTLSGSKELFRLGILRLAIPLAAQILLSIVLAILVHGSAEVNKVTVSSNGGSFGVGLVLLLLSLVFRFGAQKDAEAKAVQEETQAAPESEEPSNSGESSEEVSEQ